MLETTELLVRSLAQPGVFEHPARSIRILSTHISWIVLTGDYAYKIKKPVKFGFLDFSTLALRRRYCEAELRLNRRFAASIYLDVVAIRGSADAPRLQGKGPVIEYAVRMKEFSQQALLSAHAQAATLTRDVIDALAQRVGELHITAKTASAAGNYGHAANIEHWSSENLVQLEAAIPPGSMPETYQRLCRWYRQHQDFGQRFEQRLRAGNVRDCHGDLHLGNIALIDGEITPFDCIEFNPELRWIDVISEAAFVAMDLEARGYPGFSWRFISRYLERTSDYDGVSLLRYYVVYRALVRAKVEALRVDTATRDTPGAFAGALDYIELAGRWANRHCPGLILMHGLSGSGKSTVAVQLVEALGAIQLRSDIVRKQLHGLAAGASSHSQPGQHIYSADASAETYRRLSELAAGIIDSGFPVIVDAAFLMRSQRASLLELAASVGIPCIVVSCNAPTEELRARILARENDPSEATLQVLEWQLQKREEVSLGEPGIGAIVDVGADGLKTGQIDQISELLNP